jgi:hypothetical protein
MQKPKRHQYKHTKSRYQVKNWREYEAGLRRRGDLTVWLADEALAAWQAAPSGKPGGQQRYADIAIEAALTVRMVFHLPLRQTEGFLRSLAQMLDVDLPIPDHGDTWRRRSTTPVSSLGLSSRFTRSTTIIAVVADGQFAIAPANIRGQRMD